jgi:hypothetical protein
MEMHEFFAVLGVVILWVVLAALVVAVIFSNND